MHKIFVFLRKLLTDKPCMHVKKTNLSQGSNFAKVIWWLAPQKYFSSTIVRWWIVFTIMQVQECAIFAVWNPKSTLENRQVLYLAQKVDPISAVADNESLMKGKTEVGYESSMYPSFSALYAVSGHLGNLYIQTEPMFLSPNIWKFSYTWPKFQSIYRVQPPPPPVVSVSLKIPRNPFCSSASHCTINNANIVVFPLHVCVKPTKFNSSRWFSAELTRKNNNNQKHFMGSESLRNLIYTFQFQLVMLATLKLKVKDGRAFLCIKLHIFKVQPD